MLDKEVETIENILAWDKGNQGTVTAITVRFFLRDRGGILVSPFPPKRAGVSRIRRTRVALTKISFLRKGRSFPGKKSDRFFRSASLPTKADVAIPAVPTRREE